MSDADAAKQTKAEPTPNTSAGGAPSTREPYLAKETKRMLWSLLPAGITGLVMLCLLVSTHLDSHYGTSRAQDLNVVTDAIVLFFVAVMFIGSLCFAWNVYRDRD